MRFYKDSRGFTLVELMIIISIIGILAAALFPSMSGYLMRARDTGRIADVSEIGKSLRVYNIDKEAFPAGNIDGCYPSDTLVPDYLSRVRRSPSGSGYNEGCGKNGLYAYGSDLSAVLVMATLENTSGGNYSGSTVGFTGSLSALGYYNALVSSRRGSGPLYLWVDAGTLAGGAGGSVASVNVS